MAKYNKELLEEIVQWVQENGLIDYGGAKLISFLRHFKIDDRTFYRWLHGREGFKEAIDAAKEHFKSTLTQEIALSMARLAKGYEREETETEYIPDKDGRPIIKRQKNKIVHYQPNVAAGIFLLTNLAPELYQNKQRMDVGGNLDTKVEIGFVDAEVAPVEDEEDVDL